MTPKAVYIAEITIEEIVEFVEERADSSVTSFIPKEVIEEEGEELVPAVPIDDCEDGALFNFIAPQLKKMRIINNVISTVSNVESAATCAALCNDAGVQCVSFWYRGSIQKCKLFPSDGTLADLSDESAGYYVRGEGCQNPDPCASEEDEQGGVYGTEFSLVAEETECGHTGGPNHEVYKGYAKTIAECSGLCAGLSKWFLYGLETGDAGTRRCDSTKGCYCYCEPGVDAVCEHITHTGYNLYVFGQPHPRCRSPPRRGERKRPPPTAARRKQRKEASGGMQEKAEEQATAPDVAMGSGTGGRRWLTSTLRYKTE